MKRYRVIRTADGDEDEVIFQFQSDTLEEAENIFRIDHEYDAYEFLPFKFYYLSIEERMDNGRYKLIKRVAQVVD